MKFATVRAFALSLPEVTEEPHHQFGSFRVRGRIFATFPDERMLHVFLPEAEREQALALHPEFIEKLPWGGKVVGLRVLLERATPRVVEGLLRQAWRYKAPKRLDAG